MNRKPLVLAVSIALAACAAGVGAQTPAAKPRMPQGVRHKSFKITPR
jgi:hypothetical protein